MTALVNLLDLARMTTATTGTGTLTLGSAVSGYLTFAQAGAVDGKTYTYGIFDSAGASEIGRGVYTSSGTTLSRSVLRSTNSNSPISLSGTAEVFITAAAEDFSEFRNDIELVLAEVEMRLADIDNVAEFLGSTGNRVADSFDALTFVDTVGSTNLDTGTAGLLKPTIGSGSTQTLQTVNGTVNPSPGQILVDRSVALTPGDVINKIGASLSSGQTITLKIVKRNSSVNYDIVVSQSLVHPGGGFADVTLSSPFTVPGSGSYYVGLYAATTISGATGQARGFGSGGDTGVSSSVTFGEDTGTVPVLRVVKNITTNNATIKSTGLTAASAPTTMKVVALVNHVDSATAGTDYKFKVSRDAGSHLSAYLSLNDRVTLPGGNLHLIESDPIDISGLTTGTSPLWQFETLNNKMVELQGLYFYWT